MSAAGSAQRATTGAAEQSSFLGRIGAQVAAWLGLETGKTAETTTGAATRTGELSAEAMAAIGESKAVAAATIPAYTAEAAMGAASAMAAIPYVGPALAAAAAADMEAMGAGFLAMASAENGWERVPADGMLTELHKDEMVLPARVAGPLRGLAASLPAYGLPSQMAKATSTGAIAASGSAIGGMRLGDTHTHNHFSPTVNFTAQGRLTRDELKDQADIIVGVIADAHRNGDSRLRKSFGKLGSRG